MENSPFFCLNYWTLELEEKIMQKQNYVQQSNGTKAIAIDNRVELMKYRILQLTALIIGAASAIGLHFIFAH